ncbi:MAG: glycoside hydrolase family 127 protein [Candidatus Nealsonbacteria bacterium]|nr:glycoside hydrolase family 127 protein [Candidatus Nealsonbacteria bacterium]
MKLARTILSLTAIGTMITVANGQPPQPHKSPHQRLSAPPINAVHVADAFWAPRIATCRKVTLPYCFDTCEKTERILNFDRAAGVAPGKFAGIWFNDSDVYKVLEGAAYSLAIRPDEQLDKLTDNVIARIAAAQQPDGYLYCFFTIDNADQRFKNILPNARHELYCMGHLIEAGATHFEMTGKRNLLEVACKLADHVDSVFGPGRRQEVPEHQSIESGLIKLYRVTGEKRYLELARFFIDQRGNAAGHKLYGAYSQDHEPARKQSEVVGHAVRAMYNCTAMADAYLESGDRELLTACRRLWQNTTQQKMYLTGGVGATRHGEAFGSNYELPNETAYAETCAAIGLIFFAHRMLLIEPDAQYADVLERVLYNGFLSSVSLEGDKFFYQNRLATRGDYRRQAWYGCACCPSNIVRVFPKIGRYIYAHDDRAIYVNLYIGGSGKMKLGETDVAITQLTRYPWDGNVKLVVHPAAEKQFDLCLRIPGWCTELQTPGGLYRVADREPSKQVTVKVNGESIEASHRQQGYVRIDRKWTRGDVVELDLPMPIRRIRAHAKVEADVGRVALQRGPIVYCVEAVDHKVDVRQLSLPADAKLQAEHRPDLLGGVSVITGEGTVREAESGELKPARLLAVPYYAWDNRRGGPMAVWLPEDPQLATPVAKPTIASNARASASHCWSRDTVEAMNDQIEPPNSRDLSVPRHTWWDHRGSKEWVQYDFAAPRNVSAVEVYWFDDHTRGNCRVPDSWSLLCKDGEAWTPVDGASAYGIEQDKYNRVTFDPVETTALRIEVQLHKDYSGGVLQWRVHGVGQGLP